MTAHKRDGDRRSEPPQRIATVVAATRDGRGSEHPAVGRRRASQAGRSVSAGQCRADRSHRTGGLLGEPAGPADGRDRHAQRQRERRSQRRVAPGADCRRASGAGKRCRWPLGGARAPVAQQTRRISSAQRAEHHPGRAVARRGCSRAAACEARGRCGCEFHVCLACHPASGFTPNPSRPSRRRACRPRRNRWRCRRRRSWRIRPRRVVWLLPGYSRAFARTAPPRRQRSCSRGMGC